MNKRYHTTQGDYHEPEGNRDCFLRRGRLFRPCRGRGAVRQLHEAGFALGDFSIVGRCSQGTDAPVGSVTRRDYVKTGAESGAVFGWLLGLFMGVGFLILPDVGLVVVAGSISAALLAGIEGSVAGTTVGSLAGALVGWGVPKDRALNYETHVKEGKFLVVVRSNPEVVASARRLLASHGPDHIDAYDPPAV